MLLSQGGTKDQEVREGEAQTTTSPLPQVKCKIDQYSQLPTPAKGWNGGKVMHIPEYILNKVSGLKYTYN